MEPRPESVTRLATVLAAARIAHEAIFELHRRLSAAGRGGTRPRELLAESARIVLSDLPEALAEALRLQALWSEKSLLDPAEADRVSQEFAAELERAEPRVRRLLARQRELASELHSLLREANG